MTRDDGQQRLLHLEGTVAMVTGGAGGIGRSVVQTLDASGADVVTVDLPGVANAVLFLVSHMGRHVTGQVLRVDGGQLTA